MVGKRFPVGGETLVRSDGSDTSKEAAEFLKKGGLSSLQRYVYLMIGQFTDLSLKQNFDISVSRGSLVSYSGFSARYSELARAGLIECTGRTINPSGRGARTWKIVKK